MATYISIKNTLLKLLMQNRGAAFGRPQRGAAGGGPPRGPHTENCFCKARHRPSLIFINTMVFRGAETTFESLFCTYKTSFVQKNHFRPSAAGGGRRDLRNEHILHTCTAFSTFFDQKRVLLGRRPAGQPPAQPPGLAGQPGPPK